MLVALAIFDESARCELFVYDEWGGRHVLYIRESKYTIHLG